MQNIITVSLIASQVAAVLLNNTSQTAAQVADPECPENGCTSQDSTNVNTDAADDQTSDATGDADSTDLVQYFNGHAVDSSELTLAQVQGDAPTITLNGRMAIVKGMGFDTQDWGNVMGYGQAWTLEAATTLAQEVIAMNNYQSNKICFWSGPQSGWFDIIDVHRNNRWGPKFYSGDAVVNNGFEPYMFILDHNG